MLVRLMLNPVRRGAGRFPTVVSAFVLGSAVLVSRAAGQDAGEAIPYFIADGAGVPGYQPPAIGWRTGPCRVRGVGAGGRRPAAVRGSQRSGRDHPPDLDCPRSGVYGEMRRVIIDDRPRAFVYVTPGIKGQGPAIARLAARDPLLRDTIVYLTCVHELGHAIVT